MFRDWRITALGNNNYRISSGIVYLKVLKDMLKERLQKDKGEGKGQDTRDLKIGKRAVSPKVWLINGSWTRSYAVAFLLFLWPVPILPWFPYSCSLALSLVSLLSLHRSFFNLLIYCCCSLSLIPWPLTCSCFSSWCLPSCLIPSFLLTFMTCIFYNLISVP